MQWLGNNSYLGLFVGKQVQNLEENSLTKPQCQRVRWNRKGEGLTQQGKKTLTSAKKGGKAKIGNKSASWKCGWGEMKNKG